MNIKLTPQTLSALLNLNIITNTTPKGAGMSFVKKTFKLKKV
jgi:hypothetical protein